MTKEQNRQTIVNAILHRKLKLSNTKLTKTWDELGIKGEQYETH